jgi:hypothetical protein
MCDLDIVAAIVLATLRDGQNPPLTPPVSGGEKAAI